MTPNPFLNVDWQKIFIDNNLADFDALWDLKAAWFEEPNVRRGGWSGVVKIHLETPEGKVGVFIKRQENHISKTFLHPIKGIATFQKEFHNLLRLSNHKIPVLELIYFSQEGSRAILITKELEGYHSLDSKELSHLTTKEKYTLLSKMAIASSAMHQCRYQHNCFYPKHIFAKNINGDWDIRFIDLEKLKRTLLVKQSKMRDLSTLNRRVDNNYWSLKDRLYFFKIYCNEKKLSANSKKVWHALEKDFLLKTATK